MINRARPISDYAAGDPEPQPAPRPGQTGLGRLYLRLPSEEGRLYPKVRAILNMFPGGSETVIYFADTKLRRGTRCGMAEPRLRELKNVRGEGNVVVK